MAGETWKSHQMTTRERDARMDEAQQLGDVDTAAHDHDEWMFGPELTTRRLCTVSYPGVTVDLELTLTEVVELLSADRPVTVIVHPAAA